MTIQTLPTIDGVRRLLSQLLGQPVTVTPGTPFVAGPKTPSIVAVYARDDGAIASAWAADVPLAAWAGAALTLIPANVAQACISQGRLTDMTCENYQELMNVASTLFNVDGSPHTKLLSIHQVPLEAVPEGATLLLQKPAGRLDLTIDIPRYGAGRASLVVT